METLAQALTSVVRHNDRRTAIVDDEGRFTWAEFGERVARAAGLLAGLGIKRGDRFAICARNGFRFQELLFAGYWLGAVPVPLNWRLAPPEMAHVLTDSECRVAAVEDTFIEVFDAEVLAPWRDGLLYLAARPAEVAWPQYEAALGEAEPVPAAEGHEDDDALLLYTGGTTGRAKGVRLSHRNILSNGVAFGLGLGARPDDVYLHLAPMFHSADLLSTGWFLTGAAQCYLPAFSPAAFLRVIERYKATVTIAVPTMLMMTVPDPAMKTADLSSLRLLGYGSAPMALEWIHKTAAAFPDVDFLNCYGLTETAPDVTIFDADEFRAAIASGARDGPIRSVGKPNVLQEVKVADDRGNELACGEVGELWARGPNITKGYLNLPEETAAALVDGWLRTGDIARMDADGYVYLLDRRKDMIITGGENVYSSEVEAALYQHPGVNECAVIGVPDDKMGEALVAVIVPAPGAEPTAGDIIEFCRPLIAGYKIPRRIDFVEAMPKSAMGKILKVDLRKTYGS